MSKYVDRIMEEVYDTFANHYTDKEERVDFLEDLIKALKDELDEIMNTCENGEDCDCCDGDDQVLI